MKAFSILLLCVFLSTTSFSQKKSGTVYSDHEAITKTRELWKAFEAGDADAFLSFMSDTVKVFVNGNKVNSSKERTVSYINYYRDNYDNVMIQDDKPAYPDAIDYKESSIWVQDWVRLTGTHRETGINLDLPVHHLYSFNKDGKITSLHYYFNNDIFEEINNSKRTIENGKLYINHPHIITVRKMVNAFKEKDLDKWASFFDTKASFGNSAMKFGETNDLEKQMESLKESRFLQPETKFKITQVGYPDCMYYAKNDQYVVYSWWLYTEWGKDKKIEVPYMLDCTFNKDGKIIREYIWYSSNQFKE
ncbi:nuclear transport factor 2 family protein [Ancylomarina salipaludis]|uniref:Nuclear transport factor 2 family protein n=1 Tax=Ancylomarina salipaludis TaxID=2501299 RepID=A0A4Q1JJJ5_9BACT|nr:nuclear transport factor 2 family protein [Ancylomarina salipaludis]RXQ91008.1 nuclear transport factor 2 family protein [Ancylomarina salipaludis]